MALQDLTPQLRTRLNRMERIVGWFVFFATVLLLFGFGYYIYHTAERKGWFKIKAPFFTYVQSSAGLSVGDPVVMMGFAVGNITSVEPQKPYEKNNVKVQFEIVEPYFRYLWTGGSYVKVNAAGFLNQRQLEVTRATNGYAIVVTQPVSVLGLDEAKKTATASPGHWQLAQDVFYEKTNLAFHAYDHVEAVLDESNAQLLAQCVFESNSIYVFDNTVNRKRIVASWDGRFHHYKIFQPGDDTAWLRAVETPPISDQLQAMVSQVQNALPGILSLTNKLSTVLDNAANVTSNLNTAIIEAHPMLTNLNSLLVDTGTNLNTLAASLDQTLENLSDITSNLNTQVQANTNLLGSISKIVVDTDDFVQGLKRHWLLRSAFKVKPTNAPPAKAISPKR
jgi:ABC-type transporter Mla subunit MlaD